MPRYCVSQSEQGGGGSPFIDVKMKRLNIMDMESLRLVKYDPVHILLNRKIRSTSVFLLISET